MSRYLSLVESLVKMGVHSLKFVEEKNTTGLEDAASSTGISKPEGVNRSWLGEIPNLSVIPTLTVTVPVADCPR